MNRNQLYSLFVILTVLTFANAILMTLPKCLKRFARSISYEWYLKQLQYIV